jgi:hypothetical protein
MISAIIDWTLVILLFIALITIFAAAFIVLLPIMIVFGCLIAVIGIIGIIFEIFQEKIKK